ncbi:hypothetical protein [Shinella zoogloeoides]|uniref:Uncharacterized protein n=1 Tax=Shinella zoogloeoides TaxID=352475 RepID=A0A6N8TJP9_SHIZO|nr:hypothetical protein [Shinella zoogloeoides]MXO01334.1 hypothetical protein [Shinella zoogloeoides]UEX81569.1 hypothetical protein K8M09_18735 [Shinella zoogloeoides]
MTDTSNDKPTTGTTPQGEATRPRQVNLPSEGGQEDPLGLLPSFKYLEFPHSVSHAILIGMDDNEAATVPDLAARLDIPFDQVQACMEATRERLSNLIATIPPTGPTSVRNRTGNGP